MNYLRNSCISGFCDCFQKVGHLREVINKLGAAIIMINQEGIIQLANEKALTLYGYNGEQMTDLDFAKLGAEIAPFNGDSVKKWLKTVIDTDYLTVEWLSRDKLGRHFWADVSFSKIEYGTRSMILALISDSSKFKAAQWEREAYERKYEALINAMPDVILHVDNNARILSCTTSHSNKLIMPGDKLVGKYFHEIMQPRLANEFLMNILLVLSNREPQVLEYAMPLMGECTYHEARIVYLDYKEVMLICRDISDRKRSERELRYISYHDALTGLYNRAYFESEAKRAILSARFPLALIVCDVDGLKIINDTFGHEAGDRLLKAAAETLHQAVPDNVVLSRIGGDEFVVLMLNANKTEVVEVCRQIQEKIAEFNEVRKSFHLSISVGYATGDGSTENIKELFKEADDNMYKAKLQRSPSVRSKLSYTIADMIKFNEACNE